ncbi:Uncharacterised protein g3046 [Pycnogonum litorale]
MTGIRYCFQAYLMLPFFLKTPEKLTRVSKLEWILMALSGFTVTFASVLAYSSIATIPLMDATTIINAQPIVVLVISAVWLKEQIGFIDFFTIILVSVGVIFICQPEFIFSVQPLQSGSSTQLWHGYMYGIISAVANGFTTCLVRRVKYAGSATIVVIQGIFSITFSLVISVITGNGGDPSSVEDVLNVVVISVLMTIGRVFITVGLTLEDSAIITVVATTEIVFSLILQILLFKTYPNWLSSMGAFLVMSGVILLSLKKYFHRCRNMNNTNEKHNDQESEKIMILSGNKR